MTSEPSPSDQPQADNLPAVAKLAPTEFIFVICQQGVEAAVKHEVAAAHPSLKFAFSRPGFVTFKQDEGAKLPLKFSLVSTFARTYGWSAGKINSSDGQTLIDAVAESPAAATCQHIHFWQRDPCLPGQRGFEPGPSVLAHEMANKLAEHSVFAGRKVYVNRMARANDLVLDVVMVEPDEWWFGFHYATTTAGRWPGGAPALDVEADVVSRAHFKLDEALRWSGITIQPGDVCAELGAAPGGACQLLLEKEAKVIGIDPAEMESDVLEHANFTHIRRRGNEVKKKDIKDVRWLFSDMNVTPTYTVDAVQAIVSNDTVNVTGLVLTMKLTDMKLADEIPAIRKRVKELGFAVIKTRQLAFNRNEFCLVAVKDKFALRSSKQKPRKPKPRPKKKPKPKAKKDGGTPS